VSDKAWPVLICPDCDGSGHLGRAADGRKYACETCGGHEDSLGRGWVEVTQAAELDALRERVAELEADHAEQVELVCQFAAERDALRATIQRHALDNLALDGQAQELSARVAELEQSVHDLCFERGALTMERDRLREALTEAPDPACYSRSATHDRAGDPYDEDYAYWFSGTRREALDG
jgi:hypothetical protein